MNEKIPDPIAIKSTVWTCNHCKAWICRVPQWCGDDGIGECDKCGCTSIVGRDGRPFGPMSQWWEIYVKHFREFVDLGMFDPNDVCRESLLRSVIMPEGWAAPTAESLDPDLIICEVDYVP